MVNLFEMADEKLIEKAIKKAQDDSLSQRDRQELFIKENVGKFGGNRAQFEAKMQELMEGFLLQKP